MMAGRLTVSLIIPLLALAAGMWLAVPVKADEPTVTFDRAEPGEALQGGIGTSIEKLDDEALAHALFGIPESRRMDFMLGRALFRKNWVTAPASTRSSDGLGPLYNARSCQACHENDGRGRPFFATKPGDGLALHLSNGPDDQPDPIYGRQLQDKAVAGLGAEAAPSVRFERRIMRYADGVETTLQTPVFSVRDPANGPLDPATALSGRLAPPLAGMGLIEAIDDASLLAHADPDDRDGDGISGRASMVKDRNGTLRVGRFGWKAAQADVMSQTAHALAIDMGLSTRLKPLPMGDCTLRQTECLARPDGQDGTNQPEVADAALDRMTFYVQALSVPARRKADSDAVLAGKAVFFATGCAACHVPKHRTSDKTGLAPLDSQLIWPYSDFLLHDMGDGLADGSGREWRTPPLWAIGLTKTVSGEEFYLHDGRARSLEEAILWHGGEADKARTAWQNLNAQDRRALIGFLESL